MMRIKTIVRRTFFSFTVLCALATSARSDEAPVVDSDVVHFSFERTPWRAVLEWLSDEAGLALYVGDPPPGSFTYSDTRAYTVDQAISRINLFLIPQRYSLVRSGNILSVISLDDERSVRQLDVMAETVTVEQLAKRRKNDLVKCLFPLGQIAADHALEELSGLMLVREPTVLANTNQILLTDTVAKLLMVKQILNTLEAPDESTGPVKRFPLKGIDPEEALVQIRPHVRLEPLAMTGADINLSVDLERGQLLASGSNENLEAVANVINILHDTRKTAPPAEETPFATHDIGEADLQTVVSVLHTLLADEDVRMGVDAKSNQIAIMAREGVHELIDKTIEELTGTADTNVFKAIRVSSVDPRYAALILNEMFATPPRDGQNLVGTFETPKIEADPFSGRLFIRAKRSQMDEIEQALQQFGQTTPMDNAAIRFLPYQGERAKHILDSAREFWPYSDELQIVPSSGNSAPQPLEREINPESSQDRQSVPPKGAPAGSKTNTSPIRPTQTDHNGIADGWISFQDNRLGLTRHEIAGTRSVPARFASETMEFPQHRSGAPGGASDTPVGTPRAKIRVQRTPRGFLVHSQSAEALERFESLVEMIAGPNDVEARRLAVFYLKHATVDEANRLLQRLLAEESIVASGQGFASSAPLYNGTPYLAGNAAGFPTDGFGELWTAGTASVIPDLRLNRLFVYGTATDLAGIEGHLEVIDREASIAQIKIFGTPRVIQLRHARATAVADIIRNAYAGRIAASTNERKETDTQSNSRQPSSSQTTDERGQANTNNRRQQNQSDNSGDTRKQPKLTLAIDKQSNSLVVTAPDQLAREVESLAHLIDEQSAQSIRVVSVKGFRAAHVSEILRNVLGQQARIEGRDATRQVPENPR